MELFKKKYQVKPNTMGYLYRDNVLEKQMQAGIYEIWDIQNRTDLIALPIPSKLLTVTNQEVLTSDNIALRFSFNLVYQITNGQLFLSNFALDRSIQEIIYEAEYRLSTIVQQYIRQRITLFDSESLNEKRYELTDFMTSEMKEEAAAFGITILQAQLRDLTFPKSIQDLFAKNLEAKIRAKTELENARTTVATARTLKNASELMKNDDNIKFFQMLETISKIAEKGRHTFMIGDLQTMKNNH